MTKTMRARYTLEFKQEAVRLVEGAKAQAAARHSCHGQPALPGGPNCGRRAPLFARSAGGRLGEEGRGDEG